MVEGGDVKRGCDSKVTRLTHSNCLVAVAGILPTVAMRASPGGCSGIGGGVVLVRSRSSGVAGTAVDVLVCCSDIISR